MYRVKLGDYDGAILEDDNNGPRNEGMGQVSIILAKIKRLQTKLWKKQIANIVLGDSFEKDCSRHSLFLAFVYIFIY